MSRREAIAICARARCSLGQTVEPLFGNTKHNGGVYRFHRQGSIKVRLEWRILMMTHKLTKLTVTSSSPRGA
jgi:hypothetical protein